MFANSRDFREESEGYQAVSSGRKAALIDLQRADFRFQRAAEFLAYPLLLAVQKLILCTGGRRRRARFAQRIQEPVVSV
jgi:hypothetical protein